MTPIGAAVVRRKLGHIMTSLDLLRPMGTLALDDYRARVWERKGVERISSPSAGRTCPTTTSAAS